MSRAPKEECARGFTLLELLIVVVLLAATAAVVMTRVFGGREHAQATAARSEMKKIVRKVLGDEASGFSGFHDQTRTGMITTSPFRIPPYVALLVSREAMEGYLAHLGLDQGTIDDLLQWDPNHRRGYLEGGYLKGEGMEKLPDGKDYPSVLDPWKHPYEIVVPGGDEQLAYVRSRGPDGQADTEDDLTMNFF